MNANTEEVPDNLLVLKVSLGDDGIVHLTGQAGPGSAQRLHIHVQRGSTQEDKLMRFMGLLIEDPRDDEEGWFGVVKVGSEIVAYCPHGGHTLHEGGQACVFELCDDLNLSHNHLFYLTKEAGPGKTSYSEAREKGVPPSGLTRHS